MEEQKMKNASHDKNTGSKLYHAEETITQFKAFQLLQNYLTDLTNKTKEDYHFCLSKSVMDFSVTPKTKRQFLACTSNITWKKSMTEDFKEKSKIYIYFFQN